MRVIRHKSLAQRRVKLLGSVALGSLIVGGGALAVTQLYPRLPQNLYLILGYLAAFMLFLTAVKGMMPWFFGDRGEKKTLRALESLWPSRTS